MTEIKEILEDLQARKKRLMQSVKEKEASLFSMRGGLIEIEAMIEHYSKEEEE